MWPYDSWRSFTGIPRLLDIVYLLSWSSIGMAAANCAERFDDIMIDSLADLRQGHVGFGERALPVKLPRNRKRQVSHRNSERLATVEFGFSANSPEVTSANLKRKLNAGRSPHPVSSSPFAIQYQQFVFVAGSCWLYLLLPHCGTENAETCKVESESKN